MRPRFVLQFVFALAVSAGFALAPAAAFAIEEVSDRAGELTAIESGTGDPKLDEDLAEIRATNEELYKGAPMAGGMAMTLADAIALSIENNLDVQIERHEPLIAFEDARIAWGSYDPLFGADGAYTDVREQVANTFAGGATFVGAGQLGISGLVPFLNTNYSLTSTFDRLLSTSPVQSFIPEWNSGLALEASQPLLKGLIWNEPWTRVKATEMFSDASDANFVRALMDIVQDTEFRYWDLVAQDEKVDVAQKSLETASALLDQVETQYEVGVVSKVEVVEAEAGVAERQFTLIQEQAFLLRAQDALINAVLGPHLRADTTLTIEPTDLPDDYVEYEIDVEAAVDTAFRNRPELVVAEKDVETREIELRFAKNQRLPQLDVVGAYGVGGRRGIGNPLAFGGPVTTTGTRLKDTYNDWFKNKGGRNYTIGGVVSIPIPNTAGRHGVSRADLELNRAETRLLRQQQDIILEVRDAARNVKAALEGIVAAERRTASASEQLRAERIRLEHGESTPFDVLQRERDLVDAQSQRIGALQAYRNNAARLLRSQGTILRERNVVIEQAVALR